MAVFTHIKTDSGTNADISSATAIGTYTATADKLVMVDVSIDQVAGDGDYVMYVTRQINGAGSAYRILPQTTLTAASGLTAISAQSGWITVRNGDVLTCYVDGLAGDTSTPDWTTRWFEDSGTITGVTLADDAITAASVKAEAVTKIQNGLALEATLTAIKGEGWTTQKNLTHISSSMATDDLLAAVDSKMDTINDFLDTEIAAILADTNELQTDLVNGGRIDLLIDDIKAKTDNLPASPAAVGSAMTLTAAYDKAKDDVLTPLAVVDSIVDGLKTTLDNIHDTDLPSVKTDTAAILLDTGTDGVVLANTQPAITWGQQKIIADVADEGALDISNINASGYGQFNYGRRYGLVNTGETLAGQKNDGGMRAVDGYDPALAKATDLATVDTVVDAIKAKTDNLPADPADDSDIDAQLAAIKSVIDNIHDTDLPAVKAETALIIEDTGTTIPATLGTLATTAHVQEVEDKVDTADAVADAIKAKTDNLPADPAEAGEYTAAIAALQADADAILEDTGTTLDALIKDIPTNTELATALGTADDAVLAAVAAAKTVIDNIHDTDLPAVKAETALIVEDTGTTLPATLATIAGYTDGIAGDVWSYAKRTLTHPSVSAEEPEDSNTLILYRDADIAIELTDLTIPVGAKKYIFTIKDNLDSGDDQAVLQASYSIDGSEVETNTLVYINSAEAPALTNPVTFTLTETNITIDLTAEAAALLPRYERGYLNWDLKLVTDAAVTIVLQGLAQIIGTSTRAIE